MRPDPELSRTEVHGHRLRLLTSLLSLALLVACAGPPTRDSGPKSPTPAATTAPTTPATPAVVPVPATPPPAPPVPSLTPQDVQRSVSAAIEFLQGGQEEQAESELRKALQADPGNRLAQNLLKQITDDPTVALGRESFAYRVRPGESLSLIAQRFMNDLHLFYILARYNNIKVPRTLAGGQTIRVPGKAPPPGSAAALASVPAAPVAAQPAAPAPTGAGPSGSPALPASVSAPVAQAAESDAGASQAARQPAESVATHMRAARAAFAKQDLDGALRSWEAVLAIEPANRTALLEKQKVQTLRERLRKVK